eukprot:TRINITY_DN5170_c0_g2_i1.p1 TRINITY_DN5170_c0_g2~~TRINITY_DN5170_c0_g2_i1.p1  ORF type:complete len:341 (+),score=103.25 TRINITY_DN5170_c0_g2_i1:32-1054(+)
MAARRYKEPPKYTENFFLRQKSLYELDRRSKIRQDKLQRDLLNVNFDKELNKHRIKMQSNEEETLRQEVLSTEDYEARKQKMMRRQDHFRTLRECRTVDPPDKVGGCKSKTELSVVFIGLHQQERRRRIIESKGKVASRYAGSHEDASRNKERRLRELEQKQEQKLSDLKREREERKDLRERNSIDELDQETLKRWEKRLEAERRSDRARKRNEDKMKELEEEKKARASVRQRRHEEAERIKAVWDEAERQRIQRHHDRLHREQEALEEKKRIQSEREQRWMQLEEEEKKRRREEEEEAEEFKRQMEMRSEQAKRNRETLERRITAEEEKKKKKKKSTLR